jgi:prolyl oligopeptidase PreP (S9A serine peptidase family)
MTGEEIRDLGYLKWENQWAWMETMRGKQWDNLIKREKAHYNSLANQPRVEKEARHIEDEIVRVQQYNKFPSFSIGCSTIDIFFAPNSRINWKWTWDKTLKPAYDIDVLGNIVWYISAHDEELHKNKLICETSDGKIIWSKSSVSLQVAVIGELCYYIKTIDYFRTIELCVCNAQTGNNEKVLYREPDKSRDLILVKGANRTLYFKSEDSSNTKTYRVDGTKLIQLAKNTLKQYPLGESVFGDDCILVRNSMFEPWTAKGEPVRDWILPKEEIQWVNIQSGNILTIHEGAQSIWFCYPKKPPKLIFKIKVGSIETTRWITWENNLVQSFVVKSPFETPYMIHIINNKIIRDERPIHIKHPLEFKPLEVHRFHATSKDGTKVPYITVNIKGIKPKAQLIYVYGAYGSTTPVDWPYSSWYSLLIRKWAIVFAMVRGGGDIDAAWAEMPRRENRYLSVDDYEAVIQSSQSKFKLGPKETAIFGRSAGGLPVGAIIARFPYGDLVGAAWTEVPYVDVLRTSSNPELPLTIGEFEEFGNPLRRLLNFRGLLSVSPVNSLPIGGAPGVFVMSRVGLLDKQVFAYESYKWIQKLRGNQSLDDTNMSEAKGKYVTFEKNESHRYRAHRLPRFRAIDFAILDSWIEGRLKM